LRTELPDPRVRRRMMLVATVCLAGAAALAPRAACAENLFEKFFGGFQKQQRQAPSQANFFADPFGQNQSSVPPARPVSSGSGVAYCVRSCDGKYFPLSRGNASAAQMCQAFCPASPTKVFFGSSIDSATTAAGERYAESENAFAYRKALRADCTCNGRDAAGLAPVDLTLDTSLRAGDVIATTDGLVAYSGVRIGNSQSAEFLPVASFPGLSADVRTRLGEMKVAPRNQDATDNETLLDSDRALQPVTSAPKTISLPNKRAQVN
jgi:Protein of unknown function (DUF2865)